MVVRTRLARMVAAGFAAPLLSVAAAAAAAAHGAPLSPVSRSAACGADGSAQQTAACRAARAGDEGLWFDQWDNVRVADVNGRDRQVIPDGHLCSGGIAHFAGLDLARTDWPTTQVRAGGQLSVRYRATIPHQGTFRLYVTNAGYDPKRPLTWAELDAKPFLTAVNPSLQSGAYVFQGTLPAGKVGRQIIFTIWQNSSTVDTYYSCSDVVFTAKRASAGATAKSGPATGKVGTATSAAAGPGPTALSSANSGADAAGTSDLGAGAVARVSADEARNAGTSPATGSSFLRLTLAGLGLLGLVGAVTALGYRVRRRT
jgi:predicted carbohydrate-binding protein with CBM5 and CBM33 domain